jgi:hypothetical protein
MGRSAIQIVAFVDGSSSVFVGISIYVVGNVTTSGLWRNVEER